MRRKVKGKDLGIIRNMSLSIFVPKEEHLDLESTEELREGTLGMLEIGGPTSFMRVLRGSTLIIPEIENPTLAILGVGLLTWSILRSRCQSLSLGTVGAKKLLTLPTFWTTFYMSSGVVTKIGLKLHMRAAREIVFFIIFKSDKAMTIINECVVDSSFGKGLLAILG